MRKDFFINSSSIDEVQEDSLSSSPIDSLPTYTFKAEKEDKKQKLNSSDISKSVCYYMHSENAMPDKPSMLQESVLVGEKWKGRILDVERESLVLDLRNEQTPQNRLKLRVRKDIVEGDLERINVRTSVIVSYQQVRNYQGVLEKRISIRLREPVEMPEEILEREFEAKMKKFAYMFSKK